MLTFNVTPEGQSLLNNATAGSSPLIIDGVSFYHNDRRIKTIKSTVKGCSFNDGNGIGEYVRIGVEDHTTDTYEVNQIGLYSDLVLIALSEPYSLSKTNKPLYIELYCLFKGASKCSFNNIMVSIPYATTYRDGLVRFSQDNEQHKDFTVYSSAEIDDRLEYLESLLTEGIVSWKKIGDSYITGTLQLDHIELMDSVSNPTTTLLIQIDGKDSNIPRININGHLVGEVVSSTPTITQGSVLGSNKVVNETYISSLYSNVIGSSDKHKLVSSNAVQNYVSSCLNTIDSKYVHITGNENINGNKTFNGVVYSDHFKGGYDIGSTSYSFGTAGSLTYETNIVNNTADNVHIPTSLAVKNYVTTAISEIPAVDLTPYLTKVDAQNTYQVKGNYALVSQLPTKTSDLNNDSGYITIESIPKDVSAFINDAGYLTSFTETDPTVPAWAKASHKPSYTASEVGALPDTTFIPTDTSELTNGAGFITASSLPIVNNGTLTIQKNSTTINSFTANSSSDVTVNISVPTDTGDLTNNAGYLTSSSLKTINNISLVGEGNIEIGGGGDSLIDSISVNGVTQPIEDKNVDISVPIKTSELDNDSGFITASSLPTVNNGTLTIQKNSTTIDTFTANSSSNVTIDISVPTDTNDLTNGAGFITLSDIPTYTLDDISDGINRKLSNYVPTSRTVNSKALSSNITLNLDDISDGINRKLSNYVPTSRTVNSKDLSSNITLNLDDISDGSTRKLSNYVPTSRTVNSKALSSNITLNLDDISDGTNRKIPTNVSELNNDSGYLTHHQSIKTVNNESLVGTGNVNIPTGDTNVIESISVNGTAQTVTSKNVDLLFKTINGNSIEGTGNIVVGGGGTALIDSISVNGVTQPIVNKNVDITVPPVYDGTLTIQKNSTTIDTFTANSSSNVTIDISVPEDTGDLTNNAGFITLSDIPTYTLDDVLDGTTRKLSDYVPTSRTVNSKALSSNITLNLDDVSDGSTRKLSDYVPTSRTVNSKTLSSDITLNLDDVSDGSIRKLSDYVPTSRTVNSKALSSDIALNLDDVLDGSTRKLSNYVPTSRTVNSKALSSNITLTLDDVLDGTTRVIPTVNNGTLTIQKNSITIDTFSANSSSDVTVNISVPTDTGDLTNNAGFITSSDIPTYTLDDVSDGTIRKLSDYVPTSRTVNSKALSSNITLNLDDISDGSIRKLSNYVPTNRTVNSKALSSNIILNLDDVLDGSSRKLSDYVPISRTVNSKALSSDITLTLDDVLDGTTRVIPTVNNGTLTIQKNSTTINSFTANSSSNVTVDISVPTKVSDLTNDSGYLTTADLSNYVKLQTTSYALQTIQSEIAINTTNTSGSKANTFTFSDNTLQGNGQTVFKAGTLTKAAYIYLDTYNNAGSHPKILLSASDDGSSDYDFIAFDYNNVTGASVASITPSVDGRLTTVDYVNSLLPTNYVTIDTAQEITGNKIISPTTLKIGDTTTNEDIKNYVYKRGQEFIVGTQTSETESWTGVSEQSSLYDGMCINYFLPYDSDNTYSSVTLNLTLSNGTTTGAKNVKIRGNNSVINQFKAGSIIQLTYCINKTINGTSVTGWFADAVDEATNNVRLSAQLTGRSTSIGFAIYGTQLILRGSDNKFTSICESRSTSTSKTRTTRGFYPDSIFYYSIITGVSGNAKTTKNTVWSQCDLDIRYCFNTTSLTASLPVYLVCTFKTSTSLFVLDSTWWAQSIPSTENGKYYILLGYMSTTTIMTLIGEHPVYAYKNGAIRECHISSIISDIASLDDRVNIQGTAVTHAIEMSTDQPMDDDSPANMYLAGIPSPFSDHDEGSDYGSFNLFLDSNEDTWFYIGTPMQLSQNHYPIEFNNTTVNLYGSKTFNNTTYIPTASSLVFGSSTDGNLLRIDAVDGAKTCFTGNIAFDGTIEPVRNNDAVLGSSTNKFYNIYSTTFTGSLSGKATSADNDGSGNAINTTYARYLRTYNYSGVATSSIPTTPSYDNTPTMLGITDASGTATYFTGLSAIIANTLRGWSVYGDGSVVTNLTRYSSNGIGCIKLLKISRSANASAITFGSTVSGTLYECAFVSSSSDGATSLGTGVAVSVGTWVTLSYIPSQGTSSGYACFIGLRVK